MAGLAGTRQKDAAKGLTSMGCRDVYQVVRQCLPAGAVQVVPLSLYEMLELTHPCTDRDSGDGEAVPPCWSALRGTAVVV